MRHTLGMAAMAAGLACGATTAQAGCNDLPGWAALRQALVQAVGAESSGLDLQMWATIVDRDGIVCAVAYSGATRASQWPGSRVISAQKAHTANAFSLDAPNPSTVFPGGLALSTANLYSAVQPGGSLFGLQLSNPVDTQVAYGGNAANQGTANDFMVGKRVGGVNVFGGGLALYDTSRKVVGAVGVSGDTSCADHFIGWRVRNNLNLDFLAGVPGVSGDAQRPDNIVYDITPNAAGGTGVSAGGFGHPTCIRSIVSAPGSLPAVK